MGEVLLKSKDPKPIKSLVESALEEEAKAIELGIKRTEQILTEFEKKHKTTSSEFHGKMGKGELKDTLDYIEWEGEIETLKRLKEDLTRLKEIEVCT